MLIKSIDDLKKYVTLNSQTDIKLMKPHIERAEQKYIRYYLGDVTYQELHDYVTGDDITPDEALDALLEVVEPALAFFAYKEAVPFLDVQLTNAGFGVTQNANMVPASAQRVNALKEASEEAAWDSLEKMLQFLEANKDDYADWVASTAYTLSIRNLVNDATEFDRYVNIKQSRLAFMALRATMDNVENIIMAAAISAEFIAELKSEIAENDISEANEVVLPLLKRALANLAFAEFKIKPNELSTNVEAHFNISDVIREQHKRIGNDYLYQAKTIMDANISSYGTYADSTAYIEPTDEDEARFTGITSGVRHNNADDKTFTFGA